jgi:hypothetical protein
MLLLATQAEPQMIEHAHPNLGRLIQPCRYSALAATIERGIRGRPITTVTTASDLYSS